VGEQPNSLLNIFKDDLTQEEQRHIVEGLTEVELELFDLLYKEKLTAAERITVKNAARDLLEKLKQLSAEKQFWYKNRQEQEQVKEAIKGVLHKDLPESYDKFVFNKKCDEVYNLAYERALSSDGGLYH
jgi:type I restriction enzyme R subunit